MPANYELSQEIQLIELAAQTKAEGAQQPLTLRRLGMAQQVCKEKKRETSTMIQTSTNINCRETLLGLVLYLIDK
ncbi:CLUMA_CG011283, isoform A [Clunio marinus]|uniref:CLUMA_CG011283, isoform A n=1 Tax=Clunio marinus TaxID=568069 RepID=A0A1J1IEC7_9DIPT|nr:CLUMA_CG011283, isoform A [Clunio marinus]